MSSPRGSIPAEVREVFERIDTDHSGTINRHELLVLLRTLQPSRYFGEHAVSEALREMGADKSGVVALPQFNDWFQTEGKFTASEKLDAKWKAMQARFDSAISSFVTNFAGSLGELGVAQRPTYRHARRPERCFDSPDLKGVAKYILSGRCHSVSFLTGAGVSVAAGIPDFRSPGGMYDTLRPELLTATAAERTMMAANPTHVVSWDLFRDNPLPFFELDRPFILGLAEGEWKPTATHFFMRLLHDKGLLGTVYTQNVDGLDISSGVPLENLLHCHGTMGRVECEFCKAECPRSEFLKAVRTQVKDIYGIDSAAPSSSTPLLCKACGKPGIKPAVVLYGSPLPKSFADGLNAEFPAGEATERDGGAADLLIIAGTSLTVAPVNSVLPRSGPQTPKLVINRELVGQDMGLDLEPAHAKPGDEIQRAQRATVAGAERRTSKDVFVKGDADDGFIALAIELGWLEDLAQYVDQMADESATRVRVALGRTSRQG